MIETRTFKLGLAPLFLLTFSLTRSENGTRAILSLYIYKFAIHVGMSTLN